MTREWFESESSRCGLARWLLDQGMLETGLDVLRFFEKPWNWSHEYQHYLMARCGQADLKPVAGCLLCDGSK